MDRQPVLDKRNFPPELTPEARDTTGSPVMTHQRSARGRVAAAVLVGAGAMGIADNVAAQYTSVVTALQEDPPNVVRVVSHDKAGLDFANPIAEAPLDFTPLHVARNADNDIVIGCSNGVFTVHKADDLAVKDIFEIKELDGLKVTAMDFAPDHSDLAVFIGMDEETSKQTVMVRHNNGTIQVLPIQKPELGISASPLDVKFDSNNNLLILLNGELQRYKAQDGKYVFDQRLSLKSATVDFQEVALNIIVKNGEIIVANVEDIKIISEKDLVVKKVLDAEKFNNPYLLAASETNLIAAAGSTRKFNIFDKTTGELIASLMCPQIPGEESAQSYSFLGTPSGGEYFLELMNPVTGVHAVCRIIRDPETGEYTASTHITPAVANSNEDPDDELDGVSNPVDNCKNVANPGQETPKDAGLKPVNKEDVDNGLQCQTGPLQTAGGEVLEKGYASDDGKVNVWGVENLEETETPDGKKLLTGEVTDPTTVTVAKTDPDTKITLNSPANLAVEIQEILEGTVVVTKLSDPQNPISLTKGDSLEITDEQGVVISTEGTTFVIKYKSVVQPAEDLQQSEPDELPTEDASPTDTANEETSPDTPDAAGTNDKGASPEVHGESTDTSNDEGTTPPEVAEDKKPVSHQRPEEGGFCSPEKTAPRSPQSLIAAFALMVLLALNRNPRRKED